jgi:hypothetical protein
MAVALLSACGGGGSGSSGNFVTTYQVNATAGTGGTISPATATVNAGSTTTPTVMPKNDDPSRTRFELNDLWKFPAQ